VSRSLKTPHVTRSRADCHPEVPEEAKADRGIPGQGQILEVIDGMQRLNAIFSYIEHGFLLDDKCFNINEFARARQRPRNRSSLSTAMCRHARLPTGGYDLPR
jgi:hypothetical protein